MGLGISDHYQKNLHLFSFLADSRVVNDYRLKGSMSVSIAGCLTSGRNLLIAGKSHISKPFFLIYLG